MLAGTNPPKGRVTALLLQPHSDDAVLFATFTLCRYRPHVITVLQSEVQERRGTGITNTTRIAEDECAFQIVGVTHEALDTTDAAPDWEYVRAMLAVIDDDDPVDRVFAPAVELAGGHGQHDEVGRIADDLFGARVTHYMTYVNGRGRTEGVPVEYEPEWVTVKLRALACYESQIREPSTGHHFAAALHEWYAA